MKRASWSAVLALCGLACSEPAVEGTGGGTSGATAGEESSTSADPSGGSTTADPSATGGATTAADSSSGGQAGLIPASGISIDWVEANQAVGVRIGADGGGVGGEGRTAPLLANRITLVRAFWDIGNNWEPREIEAHFTVNFADGTSDTKIDRKLVEGPSFIGNLQEAFFWGLMAEEAQPGLTYNIELFETDPAFADPAVTEPPRLPDDGSDAFVGIEESYQILKAVIVPFNYDAGGCTAEPDLSEETMQLFYDYMYMMMPVDQLDIEIRPNIDWDGELQSFVPVNQYIAGLRVDEGADPEVFYYGLINVCAGGLGGAGGLANGIPSDPTSPDVAYQRVSSGISLPDNPEFSADTFVHEVGHSLGRRHVACDGEGGTDPTYPIEGGDLGEWGFGVIDFQLRHPTVFKDYMTYCNPAWVSTWGLNKVYPVIRVLSTWDENYPGADSAPPPTPAAGSVLIGTILPDGSESWYTVPGRIGTDERSPTTKIAFETPDGTKVQEARVTELPDVGGTMIIAELPTGFDRIEGIERREGSERFGIDHTAVRAHAKTR